MSNEIKNLNDVLVQIQTFQRKSYNKKIGYANATFYSFLEEKNSQKIYDFLNRQIKANIDWKIHIYNLIEKINEIEQCKYIKLSDLKDMIKKVRLDLRNVTFVFPLKGLPIVERVELDKMTAIDLFDCVYNFNSKIDSKTQNQLENIKKQHVSAIYITQKSEPTSDSLNYYLSCIKVLRIIDILNFSSRNNKLFVRWDAYKLLSSVDSNTIKIRRNYSPIKIISNIVVANKIPVSINKRIGIGELRSELKKI